MNKVIRHLHIDATPAKICQALTTREGLAGWWSRQVEVEPGRTAYASRNPFATSRSGTASTTAPSSR